MFVGQDSPALGKVGQESSKVSSEADISSGDVLPCKRRGDGDLKSLLKAKGVG